MEAVCAGPNCCVSILVLLETALIHYDGAVKRAQKLSFNPCFIGNCSHTLKQASSPTFATVFQSLFYWKLLSYLITRRLKWQGFRCFNPCFIGNCSHTIPRGLWSKYPMGFNPCFIGNCSHTQAKKRFQSVQGEVFQSLFYWKLLSYSGQTLFYLDTHTGFNPCFIGNCSHTISDPCPLVSKITRFQSLFYWKLLSYPPGARNIISPGSFNPCFIGNCSHT